MYKTSVANIRSMVYVTTHRVRFIMVQRYNPNIHCEEAVQASLYSKQVVISTVYLSATTPYSGRSDCLYSQQRDSNGD